MSTRELFAAALQHHRAGRLFQAEALYRQILATETEHPDSLHMLGVIAQQSGQPGLAVELIRRAISHNSAVPAFHNNLGNAYVAMEKWLEAETCFRRALEWKPDYAEAHYNLGSVLRAQGRLEDAVASYQLALAHRPNHAETYLNLSNALQAQGKLEQAIEACQKALTLKPNLPSAHNNLGNLYATQERFEAASSAYARAIELKPNFAEAHHNRGLAALRLGRADEAAAACRQAVSFKPDYVAAHVILGSALRDIGRKEEAELAYQRAVALDPDCGEARLGWAIAAIPLVPDNVADAAQANDQFLARLNTLTQWSRANPGKLGEAVGSVQPFYLAYRPQDVTAALSRYGDLVCAEAAAYWKPPVASAAGASAPGDRIRLALVTGQIKRHPVWDVITRGLIQHLDRQRFEITIFHTGAATNEETAWAGAQVDHFVQGPKPTRQWLAEIAAARPEAILYPEVGMDAATCTLAALRLAPLQLASWGHPVTTGLPTIDWFISGELLEDSAAQQHYREKLLTLPGTGVCTRFAPSPGAPWDGPARQEGVVRFALCQQPLKFDPRDDGLLVRLAKAAGRCEFWLATPANMPWSAARLRARLAAAFRAEGLDPDHYLRATPWMPREQFWSFLEAMDIYLDCPAFSGYTTAWQAVNCGLPIVTLEGAFLRQRLAAGLLKQMGVADGIATSSEEYLATALRWANECRDSGSWNRRRVELRASAARADDNRAAIAALEQELWKALRDQPEWRPIR
jgi:predicted O-linked N-acetylglucosamine transferase (SPINDLY family)